MSPESIDIDVLADLDADQRRAVTVPSRLVAVIAGAGSGKTRVLTRRVAFRLLDGSAEAAHTLVLTFTREAAGELRRRLPRLGLTERITAGTFHSTAHSLLRQRWADTDRRPRTVISDRRRLVGEIAGTTDLDALVAEIDWAAARGLAGTGYLAANRHAGIDPSRVAGILDQYDTEKRRRGVIDLDDLLSSTIREIESDPAFADAVRWRFRHLLVDEAQDLNPLQHRLVDLLRHGSDDLYLVGDPAQAIYGFNGSDPTMLTDVETRFPGVEVVRLRSNHRCTPQVVAAGRHVLSSAGQIAEGVATRPDGPIVTIRSHAEARAESVGVADRIAHLDPGLVESNRVAILGRTHAVLAPIRAELVERGIAVRTDPTGGGSALAPVIAKVARINDGTALRRWTQDRLESAATGDDPDAAGEQVATAVLEFLREQPTGDGAGFRTWLNANDPFGVASNGVEVLTFHGSKGREWHTVEIVGCETSLVPHRSATTNAARDEEVRLLYVAITRATDVLSINWAERRGGYQRRLSPMLEGFVSETPPVVAPPAEIVRRDRRAGQRLRSLERLHVWRDGVAKSAGIMPSAVCSDRVLAAIVDQHPTDPDQLDAASGLGPITSRRLFAGVAAALAEPKP